MVAPLTETRRPQHAELGAFLRSRRDRLTPEDVRLISSGRRRTPGLRREEVAHLAGVGVTWYTWLEQGRAVNPSAQVLGALASALLLDTNETRYLFSLAHVEPARQVKECVAIGEDHLAVLESLLPMPACYQSARFDLLAYNRTYRFLVGDVRAHGRVNCVRLAFTDPEWGASYEDPHLVRRSIVGRMRSSFGKHADDPLFLQLVDDLREASDEFCTLWDAQDVTHHERQGKTILHPEVGRLELRFLALWVDGAPSVRLTPLTARNDSTRRRLAELDARHADEPAVHRVSPEHASA